MKLLLIFLVTVISKHSINAELTSVDYDRVALNLSLRINTFTRNLNRIDTHVQDIHNNIQKTSTEVDFGISRNNLILQLQNEFKRYQYKKGIVSCKNLYNKNVFDLEQFLKSTFIYLVDQELNRNKIGLFNIRKDVVEISSHLAGTNLLTEMNNCSRNPKACKLTNEYPNRITMDQKFVDTVEIDTNALLHNVLSNSIYPMIPESINSKIYNPVNQCMKKMPI